MADESTHEAALEIAGDAAQLAADVAAITDSTDEDDYQWLTERLDEVRELTKGNALLLSQVMERLNQSQTETDSIRQASQIVTEQNAQLVTLLQTTQASLTALTETVSSKLIPQPLATSLQAEEQAASELTAEETPIVPADGGREVTPESDASAVLTSEAAKKRRRI